MPTGAQLIDRVALHARMNGAGTNAAASSVRMEDNSAGTFTNETTDAASAATADVTTNGASFDINDAIYVGYSAVFSGLTLTISTAGLGTSTVANSVWEYWNGAQWIALTRVVDSSQSLTQVGTQTVSWAIPSDWTTTTVNAAGPFYYIRFRATANSIFTTTLPILSNLSCAGIGNDRSLILSYLQEAADRVALEAEPVHDPAPTQVILNPVASYSTGTVTMAASSASVVGSGTTWTQQMVGMLFTVTADSAGTKRTYVVKSVESTTALTLADPFLGDATGAGKAYALVAPARWDITKAPFNLTGLIAIDELTISDSSVMHYPVDQITMASMDVNNVGTTSTGTPYQFAFDYPMLALYPPPQTASTLEVKSVVDAPILADNNTEITFLPKGLQWGTLVNFAMAKAKQFKQQDDWQVYESAFLNDRTAGLPATRRWVARSGGRQGIQPTNRTLRQTSPSQDFGPFR